MVGRHESLGASISGLHGAGTDLIRSRASEGHLVLVNYRLPGTRISRRWSSRDLCHHGLPVVVVRDLVADSDFCAASSKPSMEQSDRSQ